MILYTLDIPEESPSLRHIDHDRDPERITPQEAEDPSVSEICQAIKTQIVGRHGASSTPPTVWFSSRLSELDAQLAALQNIADCLEMDFSKSRMVHKHVVFLIYPYYIINDSQVYKWASKADKVSFLACPASSL